MRARKYVVVCSRKVEQGLKTYKNWTLPLSLSVSFLLQGMCKVIHFELNTVNTETNVFSVFSLFHIVFLFANTHTHTLWNPRHSCTHGIIRRAQSDFTAQLYHLNIIFFVLWLPVGCRGPWLNMSLFWQPRQHLVFLCCVVKRPIQCGVHFHGLTLTLWWSFCHFGYFWYWYTHWQWDRARVL